MPTELHEGKDTELESGTRRRASSVFVGALVGGVIGAIVAVNVVIYSGADQGYETTLPELFRQNAAIAILAVLILAAGPVIGALWAVRRSDPSPTSHPRRRP